MFKILSLVAFFWSFLFGLFSYPLDFTQSKFEKCNRSFPKSFEWKEEQFQTENSTLKALEVQASLLAETRIKQMECLKSSFKQNDEKLELFFHLEKQRNLELELLEYANNFFHTLEKKYLFEKQESQALQSYLTTKNELYTSIHNQTLKSLDLEVEKWAFQKLYLSQLWNTYQFLKSLRKEIRKKVLEEIQN
ncbi:MAG: hypothetical protein N3A69_00925 [Leptospiraceae bacterium]|nr:hypothetical protein [Leptospiraceae bacterium]